MLEYQEMQLILLSHTGNWTPEVSNNETYGNRSTPLQVENSTEVFFPAKP